MVGAGSVLDRLIHELQVCSRAIAGIQATVESESRGRASPPPRIATAEKLVAKSLKVASTRRALQGVSDDARLRMAALVLREWRAQVRPTRARRPDVVQLACVAIANGDEPETLTIARFVAALALRSIYGIRYTPASLTLLQGAYRGLSSRFSQQKRRRVRQRDTEHERLLIDLLALDGSVYRSISDPISYYRSFIKHPFGINPRSGKRYFGNKPRNLPELHGALPPFPNVLNSAFAQPLCVPGLDEITGGLVPAVAVEGGGQVTLIAGPPGSGKTTVCLAIASRLAELGSQVRYLTTEEDPTSLSLKRAMTGTAGYVARIFWPESAAEFYEDFEVVEGRGLTDLRQIVDRIEAEIKNAMTETSTSSGSSPVFLIFPRVLVIDSLPVLLHAHRQASSDQRTARQEIGDQLRRLRELGVCVFLVGGAEERKDLGIAYLVDNVFVLSFDNDLSPQHPSRTFFIEKTRLQTSYRGRHVFHLSRRDGFIVSPSIHSVMRVLSDRPTPEPDPSHRFMVCPSIEGSRPITIRSKSQVLVYGYGSSGKARFAMGLALEPRFSAEGGPLFRPTIPLSQDRPRVLVVSFLYGPSYYKQVSGQFFEARSGGLANRPLGDAIDVLDFYPGFIDAESVLNRIRRKLASARLNGLPYTAVVVDGIHNVILQYPLLENERMMWPVLYKLFRAEEVDSVSTFTFFETMRIGRTGRDGLSEPINEQLPDSTSKVSVSNDIFYHLLVSSSDYTFVVRTDPEVHRRRDLMRVDVGPSIDGYPKGFSFQWDPSRFRPVQKVELRGHRLP